MQSNFIVTYSMKFLVLLCLLNFNAVMRWEILKGKIREDGLLILNKKTLSQAELVLQTGTFRSFMREQKINLRKFVKNCFRRSFSLKKVQFAFGKLAYHKLGFLFGRVCHRHFNHTFLNITGRMTYKILPR